jgi:hypothetical protein
MTDPLAGNLRPTSLDDRRDRKSRPGAGDAVVTVLDGLNAGDKFDTTLREMPSNEACFLIRDPIRVGQRVRVHMGNDPRHADHQTAEVTRSRMLSNGKWEIVIEYRQTQQVPKPSESQRRHERRARMSGKGE